MPCIGLPSFLQETEETEETEEDVSMPCIGLFPFLPLTRMRKRRNPKSCVNALYRASPISTKRNPLTSLRKCSVSMPCIGLLPFLRYPFKNPLKSMVSGAVFRG